MIYNKEDNSLRGRNVYLDKKHRIIYYRKRMKEGYVVTPGTERNLQTWSSRYILALIVVVFCQSFIFDNIFISLGLGLVACVFLEYKFRKLLNTYPMIQNFDTASAIPTEETQITLTTRDLIIKTVLYLALGVLLIINALISKELQGNLPMQLISYGAAVFAFYMCIRNIFLIKKKKSQ